jgi:hypothetical protein
LLIVFCDTNSVLVHAHNGSIDHLHRRIMTGRQCIHDPVPDAARRQRTKAMAGRNVANAPNLRPLSASK